MINDQTLYTSLIVTPDKIIPDWPPRHIEDVTADHFAAIAALSPEVVILGTGQRLCFPHPQVTQSLTKNGIGVEVMDTAAACRTFNVLVGEDRMVAAALIIPQNG